MLQSFQEAKTLCSACLSETAKQVAVLPQYPSKVLHLQFKLEISFLSKDPPLKKVSSIEV